MTKDGNTELEDGYLVKNKRMVYLIQKPGMLFGVFKKNHKFHRMPSFVISDNCK